jgi:hypothetical protein
MAPRIGSPMSPRHKRETVQLPRSRPREHRFPAEGLLRPVDPVSWHRFHDVDGLMTPDHVAVPTSVIIIT